jgi:hypothetical protein
LKPYKLIQNLSEKSLESNENNQIDSIGVPKIETIIFQDFKEYSKEKKKEK